MLTLFGKKKLNFSEEQVKMTYSCNICLSVFNVALYFTYYNCVFDVFPTKGAFLKA